MLPQSPGLLRLAAVVQHMPGSPRTLSEVGACVCLLDPSFGVALSGTLKNGSSVTGLGIERSSSLEGEVGPLPAACRRSKHGRHGRRSWRRVASRPAASRRVASRRVTSRRTTSHRVASRRVPSRRATSRRGVAWRGVAWRGTCPRCMLYVRVLLGYLYLHAVASCA